MWFEFIIGGLLVGAGVGWLTTARRLASRTREREDLAKSALVIEVERQMLELIAKGASLREVLDTLTRAIERLSPESHCTIMLLDTELRRVLTLASGPSLPSEYLQALGRLEIGPEVGACGSAAFRNETVIAESIATDSRFASASDFILSHGLLSVWSQPIRDSSNNVLGTFAIYRRKVTVPRAEELWMTRVAAQLAGNAIERVRAEAHLRETLERLNLAETVARFGIWEGNFLKAKITGSAGLAVMMERPPEPFELTLEEFHAMVHPDDRQRLQDTGGPKNARTGMIQDEFRLVLPSGAVHWIRSRWCYEPGESPPTKASGAMIDITKEREEAARAEQELARVSFRAQYDSLTSLLNRASLYDYIDAWVKTDSTARKPMSVVYLDLDGFKEINDTYGHEAGDKVLRHVAANILESVRGTDAVARLGGDEFVIALPEVGQLAEAGRIADLVAAAIARPLPYGKGELRIRASSGISVYPADGNSTDALLKVADEDMYRTKLARRKLAQGSDRSKSNAAAA
jgi:diguanylate cyclase (GGDEF)-like protein